VSATRSTTRFVLPRPRLEERLDEAFGKRLTLVVAGAGYGKSTLAAGWSRDVTCVWHTLTSLDRELGAFVRSLAGAFERVEVTVPDELRAATSSGASAAEALPRAEALGGLLCQSLANMLEHDVMLVLDDLHEVDESPAAARLVETLCRQAPNRLHLILLSRTEPTFPVARLRGQGQVLDIAAAELALTRAEIETLAESQLGEAEPGLASRVHQITEGWPALTRLVFESLRRAAPGERHRVLDRANSPGGPLFAYLAEEVFGHAESEVSEVLRRTALFDRFSLGLCNALRLEHASSVLGRLVRQGLFVSERDGWFTLHALAREFALGAWPLPAEERDVVLTDAAAWFESNGLHTDALQAYRSAGRSREVQAVLARYGADLLALGAAEVLVQAIGELPAELRTLEMDRLAGDAELERGNAKAAVSCFEGVGGTSGELEAAHAWRLARARYLDGDFEGAAEACARSASAAESAVCDRVYLASWAAMAANLLGHHEEARRHVESALANAGTCDDDRALADAYTAAAMVVFESGDLLEYDVHAERALACAERAGDGPRIARVRINIAAMQIESGRYAAALSELDAVLETADTGSRNAVWAFGNRGLARWMLGQLDEARADYEDARRLAGTNPLDRAFATVGLADIHRTRGNAELARRDFSEGLALAEEAHYELLTLVALCGLARSLVGDDPDEAERLTLRAVGFDSSEAAWALIAHGWIALARHDLDRARQAGEAALEIARRRRRGYETAEALELLGLASSDPVRQRTLLGEALAVWTELGNRVHVALVELALARLSTAAEGHAAAHQAERVLRSYGVRLSPTAPAGIMRALALAASPPLAIQTLGGFAVIRDGSVLAESDWQSRKARDLLKILVARRGRAVPRDVLMEALWPNDDPGLLGNRLSVALSTLRTILDPEKNRGSESLIRADREGVSLSSDLLVDVELFLREVSAGQALLAEGSAAEARARLEHAESLYAGDFLDENPYAEWSVSLREEARAAYIGAAHALAGDALAEGDCDAAVRNFLRVLDRDAHDETAHVGLVSALELAGRHGEARRTYRGYVARMEEIGVEPASYPVAG
jgi:ATP/maltotriose-dependent transcriptional regulator MalT/DNA-binding SARP family transcriptional activator